MADKTPEQKKADAQNKVANTAAEHAHTLAGVAIEGFLMFILIVILIIAIQIAGVYQLGKVAWHNPRASVGLLLGGIVLGYVF